MQQQNPNALPPGTRLDEGSVTIQEMIGSGGFGITYHAYDKEFGDIALKEFFPTGLCLRKKQMIEINPGSEDKFKKGLEAFLRESNLISQLHSHPNIVNVYYNMQENGTAYYGMEYLKGISLKQYITQNGIVSMEKAVQMMMPIFDALNYAHHNGVWHRDISPGNIFLCEDGTPKLIDFGAAHEARVLTQTFVNVATLGYASPEQESAATQLQGPWSDVYGLAAVMYFMITGEKPDCRMNNPNFRGVEKPSAKGAKIDSIAEDGLMHALEVDYSRRTQSVAAFAQEINPAYQFSTPVTPIAKPPAQQHQTVEHTKPAPKQIDEDLQPGTIMDDSTPVISQLIGKGGFGKTYSAYDADRMESIALKEFYPSKFCRRTTEGVIPLPGEEENYEKSLKAFKHEAEIMSRLSAHPNIVKVYYQFEQFNTCYYAMKLLDGQTLSSYITQHGKLNMKETITLLEPIMGALQFVHNNKILHRDVSPKNIFLENKGSDKLKNQNPVLIDFGASFEAMRRSMSIQQLQTLGYSSPEQALGSSAQQGPWSDVYSLAAVIYFCLTGQKPTSSGERSLNKLSRPSLLGASIAPEPEAVLMKALSMDYSKRYQSVADFYKALHQVLNLPDPLPKWVGDEEPPPQEAVPASKGRRMAACLCNQVLPCFAFVIVRLLLDWNGRHPVIMKTLFASGAVLLIMLAYGVISMIGKNTKGPPGERLLDLYLKNRSGTPLSSFDHFWVGLYEGIPVIPLLTTLLSDRVLFTKLFWAKKGEVLSRSSDPVTGNIKGTVRNAYLIGRLDHMTRRLQNETAVKRFVNGIDWDENSIYITNDPNVSKLHCCFYSNGKDWAIRDMESTNGTFVNGVRLGKQAIQLQSGAVIHIGQQDYQFIIKEEVQ